MAASAAQPPLLVLYGSQTGTAQVSRPAGAYGGAAWLGARIDGNFVPRSSQDVAERVARQGENRGFAVRVSSMDGHLRELAAMPAEPFVVFVASTTGDGDPPDNMRAFWSVLRRATLPATTFKGLRAAVLGLGDSR